MADKPKLPTGQVVNWDYSKAQTVYANIMGFSMTAFDLTLTFGHIGIASPTEVEASALVKVLISPEQAENLRILLDIAVKAYVENNGPLRTQGGLDIESINAQMEASRIKT